MALHFPHLPDVRLTNPPLVEVICQVRIPPILRIGKDVPSDFQELVRQRFPELEIEQPFLVRLPPPAGEGTPSSEFQPKIYHFRSLDGQGTIALAVDFYAVSTNQYRHWDDFAHDLSLAHEAVQKTYGPAYATRIGLRYVNRFTCANTSREKMAQVFDLLRPELTAQLRVDAWDDPLNQLTQLVLKDGNALLNLRTAYGEEKNEKFLLLDFDYAEESKLPLGDLLQRCHRYHTVIYDAFRWCLRDEGLTVFKPLGEA